MPASPLASRPAAVLAAMLRSDSSKPRLTFYDDAEGPTRGERIELSARVLANWVAKAGNALQEELDVAPGSVVTLVTPPHWRAVYWALATWSVGATLALASPPDEDESGSAAITLGADLVISDDPDLVGTAGLGGERAVLVSLPMLARSRPDTPAGAFDEARELATYGDVFDAWEEPAPTAAALRLGGEDTAYGDVVVHRPAWGDGPRVAVSGDLDHVLRTALSAWASDGSVVLVRDPDDDQVSRFAAEGVTVDLSRGRP